MHRHCWVTAFTAVQLKNFLQQKWEIGKCLFPDLLKSADVTPAFKKIDQLTKDYYRPISVLTCISKIFEGILYDQASVFFYTVLSVVLSAYR